MENKRNKQRGNPFIRWVVNSIVVILVGSSAFAMLMFGNDKVFIVTQEQENKAHDLKLPTTFSQEKITPPKKDNETNLGNVQTSDPSTSGGGNGTNPDPGLPGLPGSSLTVSGDGAQIVMAIQQPGYALDGHFTPYADQYGALYDALIAAGLPPEFCIGVVANVSSEGSAGMWQTSYALCTKAEAEAKNKSGGVGMMQWTFGPFKRYILDQYLNNGCFNADGSLDANKAAQTDIKFIVDMCTTSIDFAPWGGGVGGNYFAICSNQASNAKEFAEAFTDHAEKPGASCSGSGYSLMSYVSGAGSYGAACKARADRAEMIVNYLNGGN